jgi:hypothetical protein
MQDYGAGIGSVNVALSLANELALPPWTKFVSP